MLTGQRAKQAPPCNRNRGNREQISLYSFPVFLFLPPSEERREREREREKACFPHSRPADGLEKRDPGKENIRLVLKAHGHGCSFFFFFVTLP